MTTTPPPERPEPGGSPESAPSPDPAPPLPNAGGPYPAEQPRPGGGDQQQPNGDTPPQPAPPDSGSPQYPGSGTPQYPPPPSYPTGSGYDYGGYGAPPMQPRNGMGVAALVMGIIGFLIGPCSILAIIFGRIGLTRVARGEATNRGVAQAGFVLGIVTLVLWIIGMIALASR